MKLQAFYHRNRIPIYLIFISIAVFGIISLFYLDFSLIPNIEYPQLIVITVYPNASPEEVQNIISIPLEQVVLSLKGVKRVNTISREGLSVMKVAYWWGVNLSVAHIELREKMDLLKSFFPKEVKRPVIIRYQPSLDAVIGISVSSKRIGDSSLYLMCEKDIKVVLEKTEGISNVKIKGGQKPEVKVILNPDKLVKYNISVTEVKDSIGQTNKDFSVGFFNDGKIEYLVRVNSEISDYRELENIVVKEESEKLVFLKDIARIEYGVEENHSGLIIDGKSALMFLIYKQPESNLIHVSKAIDEQISFLNRRYEGDIVFYKVFDESVYIKDSLRNLIIAMALGIIFTVFSVYMFLYNLKISFIVVLSIPLSIIGTFIFMKLADISVNLLTLGGFSLAIGMIVDNAIIVVTSVIDLLYADKNDELFYSRFKHVYPAVLSATFTTIVVFFPILFLSGILKHIFIQLSIVIIISLLFSLIIAVTLIPALIGKLKVSRPNTSIPQKIWKVIEKIYQNLLVTVFKRKLLFIFFLTMIALAGIFAFLEADKQFVESFPQNYFYLKIFIKRQVPYEYTERFADFVSALIRKDPRVSKIIAMIGVDNKDVDSNLEGLYGVNTAVLKIYTEEKGRSYTELTSSIRKHLQVFTDVDFFITIPDNPVQSLITRSDFEAVVKIFDPSQDILANKTHEMISFLKKRPDIADILDSFYISNKERSLIIKRNEMAIYKMEALFLGEYITTALSGLRVGTWKDVEYEIPIRLIFDNDSFSDVDDLLSFTLKNKEGREIKLNEVLETKEVFSPNILLRENQKNYAKVEFNYHTERDLRSIRKTSAFLSSLGVDFEYVDQFSLLRENFMELLLALFLAILLEYVILASEFKSFAKPVLVIIMIPLSIPGIFLIMYLLKSSLNINTFMSIIVLTGLMVNNAIMLFLEYINGHVEDESDIVSASMKRLKPILITTISTILAIIPTLFTRNKIQIALATTIIFGLLYSTVITTIYLPVFYSIIYLNPKRNEKESL